MEARNPTWWKHSNRYNASSGCEYCQGVVDHETWCDSQNARVRYAHEVITDASRLSQADQLYLHGLGVVWREDSLQVR